MKKLRKNRIVTNYYDHDVPQLVTKEVLSPSTNTNNMQYNGCVFRVCTHRQVLRRSPSSLIKANMKVSIAQPISSI